MNAIIRKSGLFICTFRIQIVKKGLKALGNLYCSNCRKTKKQNCRECFSFLLQFVKKALGKLSNMSDALFGRLVPSEALVIRTNNLATTLKKVAVDDVKGLAMEEGPTKFKLPANLGDIGDGDINVQVWIVTVFYAFVQSFSFISPGPNHPIYCSLP